MICLLVKSQRSTFRSSQSRLPKILLIISVRDRRKRRRASDSTIKAFGSPNKQASNRVHLSGAATPRYSPLTSGHAPKPMNNEYERQ